MVTRFPYTLFLEAPDYQDHLMHGRLILLIKEDSLLYVIIGEDREIKICKAIYNQQELSQSLFLRFVFEKEPLIQGWAHRCVVLSSSPKFTLLPKSLAQKGKDTLYAQLFLQDTIYDDEVYIQDFAKDSIRCIFLDTPHIHHVLGEYLDAYVFKHLAATHFELGSLLSGDIPTHLLVHHLGKEVLTTIFKDGIFHYCNTFEYRTDSGMLYFIRSLLQVLDTPTEPPIFMIGEIDPYEPLFEYLLTHLPTFSFPQVLEKYIPSLPHSVSYWKFCHLLFT